MYKGIDTLNVCISEESTHDCFYSYNIFPKRFNRNWLYGLSGEGKQMAWLHEYTLYFLNFEPCELLKKKKGFKSYSWKRQKLEQLLLVPSPPEIQTVMLEQRIQWSRNGQQNGWGGQLCGVSRHRKDQFAGLGFARWAKQWSLSLINTRVSTWVSDAEEGLRVDESIEIPRVLWPWVSVTTDWSHQIQGTTLQRNTWNRLHKIDTPYRETVTWNLSIKDENVAKSHQTLEERQNHKKCIDWTYEFWIEWEKVSMKPTPLATQENTACVARNQSPT